MNDVLLVAAPALGLVLVGVLAGLPIGCFLMLLIQRDNRRLIDQIDRAHSSVFGGGHD